MWCGLQRMWTDVHSVPPSWERRKHEDRLIQNEHARIVLPIGSYITNTSRHALDAEAQLGALSAVEAAISSKHVISGIYPRC